MRVALLIHPARRMRHIVTSGVASLAPIYFSTLSHKWHDFTKTVTEHKKCVFRVSLQLLSETFLFLRGIHRDIIIRVHRSSREVPLILVRS